VVGWPCHPVVVPAAVLPAPRLPRAHLAACRCLCRRLCRPRHPLCHPCTPPPIAPSQWPLPPPVSLRRPTISCLLRQLPLRQLPPTPGLALQFKFEFVSFAARRFHQQSHSATPLLLSQPLPPETITSSFRSELGGAPTCGTTARWWRGAPHPAAAAAFHVPARDPHHRLSRLLRRLLLLLLSPGSPAALASRPSAAAEPPQSRLQARVAPTPPHP
jgi:hypothetical protein